MKIPAWQYCSLAAPRDAIGATARRAVYLALGFLVVACGENVTAPSASRTPTLPVGVNPNIVVMERTIDIAAHDGVAAVHETFKQTLTGKVRLAQQEQPSGAAATKGAGFDIAHLPQPTISLPARYETAICSALPRWTRTRKASAAMGSEVEMTGVGDAPASTLRVVQDGNTVATVERTWVRTPTSWQLERQVTSSADGLYRDVVTYRHLNPATRQLVNNSLPVASCATPSSARALPPGVASRSYYAPRVSSLLSPPTGATSYLGDCGSYYGDDPCFDYQMDVYEAQAEVAAAAALVGLACRVWMRVPNWTSIPCASAWVAYGLLVTKEAVAKAKLENCRQEQAAGNCGCTGGGGSGGGVNPGPTEPYSVGTTPTDVSPSISVSPGSNSTISAPGAPLSYLGDCGGSGSGGGGGDGGGGGGGGSCSYQVWEISYDGGNSWQYWGTFWTCVNMS